MVQALKHSREPQRLGDTRDWRSEGSDQTVSRGGMGYKVESLWELCPKRPEQEWGSVSQDRGLLKAEPKV